ncbi:MAG: hypothetical protein QNJ37_20975 [Crocosphaera sp.]|nr:hypothetical protein [Crocosphaera sp.]
MTQQTVGSREYKVMLQPEKFTGSQEELLEKANQFWQAFTKSIQGIVFDTDGSLDTIEKNREIRFYDTDDHLLYKSGYIFRERIDKKSEVTLKFRHGDRYISQDRDMSAAIVDQGKTKFEEDIKLPFTSLYSFSTKQEISTALSFDQLAKITELYPDLKTKLKINQKSENLHLVGNFIAKEIVIEGADFEISKKPNKIEADCALVVWYDRVVSEKPKIVEFSFKYENEQGEYDGEVAQRAYKVFQKLGNIGKGEWAKEWVNLEGMTKTKYVYSLEDK